MHHQRTAWTFYHWRENLSSLQRLACVGGSFTDSDGSRPMAFEVQKPALDAVVRNGCDCDRRSELNCPADNVIAEFGIVLRRYVLDEREMPKVKTVRNPAQPDEDPALEDPYQPARRRGDDGQQENPGCCRHDR